MFTLQIRRIFSVVLGLSLLLSAIGPLLQMTCSLENPGSHEPSEHHLAGVHSHSLMGEHHFPCSPEQDPVPVPCSQDAVPCCAFQTVPDPKIVPALVKTSRLSPSESALPYFRPPLYEEKSRISLFLAISPPEYSACPTAPDRQAFLSTFLI